jgi:F-box/leucine-rich repeat protein 2/20
MEILAEFCPLLEDVQFAPDLCTDKTIMRLAHGCTKLKRLRLRVDDDVHDSSLGALVRNNPELIYVNITCDNATGDFVRELALSCGRLTKLTLTINEVSLDAIFFLLQHCHHLAVLRFLFCILDPPMESGPEFLASSSMREVEFLEMEVEVSELNGLLRACPGLQRLELTDCSQQEGLGTLLVGKHCPRLQVLNTSKSPNIVDDAMLLDVSKHCRDLRALCISLNDTVTDAALTAVASACPQLEDVSVVGCSLATDGLLMALALGCRGLRSLYTYGCTEVTDEGMEAVVRGCPKLTVLGFPRKSACGEHLAEVLRDKYSNIRIIR